MNRTNATLICGLLILFFSSCTHHRDRLDIIPDNWLGFELGLKAPKMHRLGEATIIAGPASDRGFELPQDGLPPRVISRPVELSAGARRQAFRLLRVATRTTFRIDLPVEDAMRLRSALPRRSGVSDPRQVEEIQQLSILTPTIPTVIDDDERIRIQPTDVFPLSAIVYLTNECTGALIGHSMVLTAAHCVVNGGEGQNPGYAEQWYEFTVIPGMDRDPSCSPGNVEEACRLAPFGEFEVDSVIVPEGWMEPKGGPSGDGPSFFLHDPNDWIDDIAIVFLSESVGEDVEVFEVAALSSEQLEHAAFLNRGYPAPGPSEPEDFELWQMWGHDGYCFVEGFLAPTEGVHRIFEHQCDTSGGQSGSPIYQWRVSLDQGWRPEIAGVHSHHAFGQNYARRIVAGDSFLSFAASLDLVLP